MGSRRTGRTVELLWDCQSCGRKGILARHRTCPYCGSPKTVTNYIGDNPRSRTVSEEDKSLFTGVADWKCEYCGRLNKSDVETCIGCGSAREEAEKDYFDVRADEQKEKQKQEERRRAREHVSDVEVQSNNSQRSSSISVSRLSRGREYLSKIGIVSALVMLFALIVFLCMPKSDTLQVKSLDWYRCIDIEVEKTFTENDWDMPIGARLLYTNNEVHHYDDVIDHYEDVQVTKYKEEVTGHYYTYEDNGDGTADEIEHDITSLVPYTVIEQQAVYKKVPVYWTKYYYEIDRYVHSRDVETRGSGHTEYWGTVELGAKEREGRRSEKYSLIAVNKSDKEEKYTADYSLWSSLNSGDVIDVNIGLGNHIKLKEDK